MLFILYNTGVSFFSNIFMRSLTMVGASIRGGGAFRRVGAKLEKIGFLAALVFSANVMVGTVALAAAAADTLLSPSTPPKQHSDKVLSDMQQADVVAVSQSLLVFVVVVVVTMQAADVR